MKRRIHIGRNAWICLGCAVVVLGLLWHIMFRLTVTQVDLVSPKVKNPVRIVQLSDLHGAKFGRDNHVLINQVRQCSPDCIVVTGDIYTNGDQKGRSVAYELMRSLCEIGPVYYVSGMHNNSRVNLRRLQKAGVKVVQNRQELFMVGDTPVRIYGLGVRHGNPKVEIHRIFGAPATDSLNILISHRASVDEFAQWGADLALSSSVRRELFQLPGLGPIYSKGKWFPYLNGERPAYHRGLYTVEDTQVFLSDGLNKPALQRLLHPPQVVQITVYPQ